MACKSNNFDRESEEFQLLRCWGRKERIFQEDNE